MAIKETVTIQTVNVPTTINQIHERYALFFWNALNVQVTHVRDSHLEFKDVGDAVQVSSVTTNIEYATVTYERDKLMPYYDEVVIAEKELDACEEELNNKRKHLSDIDTKLHWVYWIIAYLIGGFLAHFVLPEVLGLIVMFLLIGLAVAYTIKRKKNGLKEYDEYKKEIDAYMPQVEAARANAINLNRKVMNELRNA